MTHYLGCSKESVYKALHKNFVTLIVYDEKLLVPQPTPKLEDHPLLPDHRCFFIVFAATFICGSLMTWQGPT
jgi:hypothetical protein